jgi:hypothetical protein
MDGDSEEIMSSIDDIDGINGINGIDSKDNIYSRGDKDNKDNINDIGTLDDKDNTENHNPHNNKHGSIYVDRKIKYIIDKCEDLMDNAKKYRIIYMIIGTILSLTVITGGGLIMVITYINPEHTYVYFIIGAVITVIQTIYSWQSFPNKALIANSYIAQFHKIKIYSESLSLRKNTMNSMISAVLKLESRLNNIEMKYFADISRVSKHPDNIHDNSANIGSISDSVSFCRSIMTERQ